MNKKMRPPVNGGGAFMLFLLVWNIILTFAVSAVYFFSRGAFRESFFLTPWYIIASQICAFLVPLCVWRVVFAKRGESQDNKFAERFPRENPGAINFILIIALSLCLQPAMMLLSAASSIFFPNNVAGTLSEMGGFSFVSMLAALALTPALCEEAVFRGFILSHYKNFSIKKAAFVNGLFFGIIHLDAQQLVYAFAMGFVFAVFVYYTRSVLAGVAAHFCINAAQLAIERIISAAGIGLEEGAAYFENGEAYSAMLYLFAVSLIFLPAVIILFRSFITHNRRRMTRSEILAGMRVSEPPDALREEESDQCGAGAFDAAFWLTVLIYVLFIAFVV